MKDYTQGLNEDRRWVDRGGALGWKAVANDRRSAYVQLVAPIYF